MWHVPSPKPSPPGAQGWVYPRLTLLTRFTGNPAHFLPKPYTSQTFPSPRCERQPGIRAAHTQPPQQQSQRRNGEAFRYPRIPFFWETSPRPHKPSPLSKTSLWVFSLHLLLKIVLWLNPQGSWRHKDVLCMMKYLSKTAVRTGPAPPPLTHWKNSVTWQTFQNMSLKKKISSRQLLE